VKEGRGHQSWNIIYFGNRYLLEISSVRLKLPRSRLDVDMKHQYICHYKQLLQRYYAI